MTYASNLQILLYGAIMISPWVALILFDVDTNIYPEDTDD